MQASQKIAKLQKTKKILIGSPDEVAFLKGYIKSAKLEQTYKLLQKTEYGKHLKKYLN